MSTPHDDLQRSLGRIEGEFTGMEARMDRFEKLVKDGFHKVDETLQRVEERLAEIEHRETERKGAWRIIVLIATLVSAAVGTAVGIAAKYLLR